MTLLEHFRRSGSWLYRWRSYVPLVTLVLMIAAIGQWGDEDALPSHLGDLLETFAALVSVAGLMVRAYTVGCAPRGTSGRNTREQEAATLNTTGPYSAVRHPLYVGNYLMGLGVSMLTFTWWLPLLYSLVFWLYYERIMFVEEAFLREQFGSDFETWARQTPAFVPSFARYSPPDLSFSLRNVLRREYNGAYAIVVLFAFFDLARDLAHGGTVRQDADTLFMAGLGTLAWLSLLLIKRRTTWFETEGR